MAEVDEIAFLYPSRGMNGAGCSTRLPQEQYRRATNVALIDELPSTRCRVRVYEFEPMVDGELDAEFFQANNVQGAAFFNPAKGQGGLSLAESNAQIMCACGGRKYSITLEGTGPSTRALVYDVSQQFQTSRMLHLVWWSSAENYAIATDGSSNTFIWDAGLRTASISYTGRAAVAFSGTVEGQTSHATGIVVTDSLKSGKPGDGFLNLKSVVGAFVAGETIQQSTITATAVNAVNGRGGMTSPGYNSVDKPNSKLPNGGTVTVYAHGRICMVVNSRQILVGDSLHKANQSTAVNLLDTTEQVYWDTGTYFLPPSSMGGVIAGAILPLRNTQHGHGEIFWHCEDGLFSLNINIAPRSSWSTQPMVKCALLSSGGGACGPYAVDLCDGDQFYRSRHGITSIRSATSDAQEGNPQLPLSEPVKTLLEGDVPEWLRFSSLVVWEAQKRLLCTIDPSLDGRFRWHSAVVVRNFNPSPTERATACWEGLWTLPPQAWGITQLVGGLFSANERMFALARGEDGVNRLVEFTGETGDDILSDGTRRPIRCQLITRAVDISRPFLKKEFVSGTLFLRNVRGSLVWGVWVRALGESRFTYWRSGRVDVAEFTGFANLEAAQPLTRGIALGAFPKDCATGHGTARAFEFLIRWQGVTQVEGLRIMAATGDAEAEKVDITDFSFTSEIPLATDYSDTEYSRDTDDWTATLPS